MKIVPRARSPIVTPLHLRVLEFVLALDVDIILIEMLSSNQK